MKQVVFKGSLLITALCTLAYLTACGGSSQPSISSTTSPTSPGTTSTSSGTPSSAPPATGSTGSGTSSGGSTSGGSTTGSGGSTTGSGSSGSSSGSGASSGSGSTSSGGGTTGTGSGSGTAGSGTGTGTSGSGTGTGSGSGTSASATEWLYAIETNSSLEQFAINSSTGALTSAGVTTGVNDRAGNIAADPQGKFFFAGYSAPGSNLSLGCTVVSYAIGANGQLTAVDQQKVPNNCDTVQSLATDPSGMNLYVSWNALMTAGHVSTYTVDRNTGHLSNSAPDVFPCCSVAMPGEVLVDPSGTHVYVSRLTPHHYPGSGGWDVFLRNPATGALTSVGQFDTQPNQTQYSDGALVLGGKYFIATGGVFYDVYAIDPATGMGTFLHHQEADTGAITADQSGNFVVTSGYAQGTVQSWRVNADGTLTAVSGGNAGQGASFVRFDRTGRYVYVQNPGLTQANTQIFAFAYDPSTANITAVSGSPFSTKAQPIAITTAGH